MRAASSSDNADEDRGMAIWDEEGGERGDNEEEEGDWLPPEDTEGRDCDIRNEVTGKVADEDRPNGWARPAATGCRCRAGQLGEG